MPRFSKWIVGLLLLGAVVFAQLHYGLTQQAMNWWRPAAQQAASQGTSQGGSAAPANSGSAGGRPAPPPIAVKVAQAGHSDFPLIVRSYGTLASPAVVNINARVSSQITKVNVTDGQMVKKDDVLVELDDRTLAANLAKDQAMLVKDQTTLANDNIVLQRAQTLVARNAGTLQDADNAGAAQKSQAQVINSDQAVVDADKLQLDFAKVRAPFNGKLGVVSAVTGQLVAASTNSVAAGSLMTVTQMQPLKVTFRLPAQSLQNIQPAMAKGDVVVRVYASGTHDLLDEGKLTFIDSAVDTPSGTIGFAATVSNGKLNQTPGQQVQVEVEYGKLTNALTVPLVAVQQGQNGSYVWLLGSDNKVKPTVVKVDRYENQLAAISKGLKDGDQVVTEGQAKMSDGALVRTEVAPVAAQNPAAPTPGSTKPEPGGAQAATPDPVTAGQKKAAGGTAQ